MLPVLTVFGICLPLTSTEKFSLYISSDTGTILYPSAISFSKIFGRAAGVFFAALWKSTIDPGFTFVVTRFMIVSGAKSFQSRLSRPAAVGIWRKTDGKSLFSLKTNRHNCIFLFILSKQGVRKYENYKYILQ